MSDVKGTTKVIINNLSHAILELASLRLRIKPGSIGTKDLPYSELPANIEKELKVFKSKRLISYAVEQQVDETVQEAPKPREDVTMENKDLSSMMAAHDQFEASKKGEANPPPPEEEEVVEEEEVFEEEEEYEELTLDDDGGEEEATPTLDYDYLNDNHTKPQLQKLARSEYDLELMPFMKKPDMIAAILKAGRDKK